MPTDETIIKLRKKLRIQPLQDTVLDAIRHAVKKANTFQAASELLDASRITIHARLRKGYSDGNKPTVTVALDDRNKAVLVYDWTACDRARKGEAK